MSLIEIDELVDSLKTISKIYQAGCLPFFSSWFGGRPDEVAMLKFVFFYEEMLTLDLVEGERVEISDPSDVEVMEDALIIWQACLLVYE